MIRIRLNPRIYAYLQEEMPEILEETGAVEETEESVKASGAVEKAERSVKASDAVEKAERSVKASGAVEKAERSVKASDAVEKAEGSVKEIGAAVKTEGESCQEERSPFKMNGQEENSNISQSEIKTCTILIDESQKDLEKLLGRLSYLDSDD